MTQTARKGKLYQLQYLIDLSCFIISHNTPYLRPSLSGSLGFLVKGGRIWGCEHAYARPHPQIRVSTTEIPEKPKLQ
jgi:hypothetical protein